MKTWMPLEPRLDFRVLVRGVIVGDQVHIKSQRRVAIDHAQKFEPFLVAMSLHALADDAAGGDIESSKQCRRPIAFVIVGHGPGPTALISLGIPKLVRFAKIRPRSFVMVFLYRYHFASVQLSRGMTNMDRLLEGIRVLD